MEKNLKTTSHDDEVDRMSELPEHIVHHIMEFLPTHTADVTRMSVLSKKFFSCWCSFPVLDFDATIISSNESKERDADSVVLNSMQYTFQHRRLNIKTCLQRLKVRGFELVNNSSSTIRLVHEMIDFAIRKQVKELNLVQYHDEGRYRFVRAKLSCFQEPVFSIKSITILALDGFHLEAQHLTLSLPLIQDFVLRDCSGITSIILRGEKLRRAHFLYCDGLEKIQVDGPTSLDVLRYGGNRYCDINLDSDKSVKRLELRHALIIDKWFTSNFCRFVESLEFYLCSLPVKTRWYFDNLKRLRLDSCHCEVEFETPNLEWLNYSGDVDSEAPLIISSRRFDAKLLVSNLNVDPLIMELSFVRLSVLIRFITQCQTLTLVCQSPKSLMHPKAVRRILNPQLHDMKHLKIESFFTEKEYNMVELIDSLLWLAPHPNTISFIDYESQAVLKSMKFNYHDATSKNESGCGSICDVECWPQHLKEVELYKFEDVDERTNLQTYFFTTFKISTVIVGHMHE